MPAAVRLHTIWIARLGVSDMTEHDQTEKELHYDNSMVVASWLVAGLLVWGVILLLLI